MSAADLFKDGFDAEFRLKNTFIMIGRTPYLVAAVYADGKIENTALSLININNMEDLSVRLGRLPLHTMFDCPSGYFEGLWWTRGPARHRYQGINASTLWAVMPNGLIETGGTGGIKQVLKTLSTQPRTRRPGKRPQGVLTRDVFIDTNNRVMIRGRYRANYVANDTVRGFTEISPLSKQLLDNAKLSLVDDSSLPKSMPENECNPCSEIIL